MLIYNSQKEFIGIDEKDLKILGFKDLKTLKSEVSDFADLFIKTPGYIHNFKHVHWIDFITCADSSEESKVIINVNGKSFKCVLNIQTIFLTDHPESKAYAVNLNHLRELTSKENDQVAGDIAATPIKPFIPTPVVAPETSENFEESEIPVSRTVHVDPYEIPLDLDFDHEDDLNIEEQVETPSYEVPHNTEEPLEVEDMDNMLDVGDLSFDEEEELQETQAPEKVSAKVEVVTENFDNGYVYDPHVASDELGLPIDLIEEFIQDFIMQAKEFKDDLYTSLNDGNLDNVKILSHKLKGVAANLRIEDAFETLSIINTATDINIITENLSTFYKIIAKLAGEEVQVEKTVAVEETESLMLQEEEPALAVAEEKNETKIDLPMEEEAEDEEDEDLYSIDDSEVPQKIEIPELADDDFLSSDLELQEIDNELNDIEDIELLELDKELDSSETSLDDLDFKNDSVAVEYSKRSAAGEIGLDQESFEELLTDYLHEADTITKEMHTSMANDDFHALRGEAIKLKGMSDNMRINNFMPELNTIMTSNEKETVADAIETIDAILAKISKIED